MDNNLLQIKIKQRLNKLASLDFDNIECWQVAEAVNKAQLEWTRRQHNGVNIKKEGSEQSLTLVDDLNILLSSRNLNFVTKSDYVEITVPTDYMYYNRVDVFASSDCCADRKMTVYEVEEANLSLMLTSTNKNPNFAWAETLCTRIGNKIRIYTTDFSITSVNLTYFRKPREVQILNCIDIATGAPFLSNQTMEFSDEVCEIIIDNAVAILAGDIESMNQYQREKTATQENS